MKFIYSRADAVWGELPWKPPTLLTHLCLHPWRANTVGWAFTQTYCTRGMNSALKENNKNIHILHWTDTSENSRIEDTVLLEILVTWKERELKNITGSSERWTEKEIWVNNITRESHGLHLSFSAQSFQVSALGFTAVISENGLISRLFAYFPRKITYPGIHEGFLTAQDGILGVQRYIRQIVLMPAGKPALRYHQGFNDLFFLLHQEFLVNNLELK